MASNLTFTGERFLPGCAGEIAYEHWHRYAFARRFCEGKSVLDAACGEGYGTSLLASRAASACGVDIDARTVQHATRRYVGVERLRFIEASCTRLPFPEASFDVVVSFETIEHLEASEQAVMLEEFARVLKRDGVLVISSPNKRLYSDERDYVNEFHRHELYRNDFAALLSPSFAAQRWYHQRLGFWSGIWAEGDGDRAEAWRGDAEQVASCTAPEGVYFIVVAARSAVTLPPPGPWISLFADAEDSEVKRAEANAREVLRLDGLLAESNAALHRYAERAQQLEAQLARLEAAQVEHEAQLAERAKAIAVLERRIEELVATVRAEQARLEGALAAQERIIAYRQSFRWWLRMPWIRARLWLARSR
jgi:SAM-dependent methyltransferase